MSPCFLQGQLVPPGLIPGERRGGGVSSEFGTRERLLQTASANCNRSSHQLAGVPGVLHTHTVPSLEIRWLGPYYTFLPFQPQFEQVVGTQCGPSGDGAKESLLGNLSSPKSITPQSHRK